MKEHLIQKINSRQAVIGIVGLGYVGLPLMLRFTEAKFAVVGFDIDKVKVAKLNEGRSYIGHIPSTEIAERSSLPIPCKYWYFQKYHPEQ